MKQPKKPERKLKNLRRKQNFMYIMLLSLVTIVVWIGFSIFLSQEKNPIDPELIKMSLPLNPNINMQVLNTLQQKKDYSDAELKDFTIYTLITDKATRQKVLITLDEYQKRQQEEALKKLKPSPSPVLNPEPSPEVSEPIPAQETIPEPEPILEG